MALAALICAASECAAAPGHTAQPFQPTYTAARFLFESWRRDIYSHVKSAVQRICPKHAQNVGRVVVCDAEKLAGRLQKGDLVFLESGAYSGVHYSRFYHVLETIARGTCSEVSGVGRYPHPIERPRSEFSIKSKSADALERLLSKLSKKGVSVILTFPEEETSNGLSGAIVERIAKRHFRCKRTLVNRRSLALWEEIWRIEEPGFRHTK